LGLILYRKGLAEQARSELESAYQLTKGHGDDEEIGKAATNLGNLFHEQGHDAEAEPYLREALNLARRHNHRGTIRSVTFLLAEVALRRGDLESAHSHITESLEIAIELDDVVGIADLMLPVSALLHEFGLYEDAARAIGGLRTVLSATGQTLEPTAAARRDVLIQALSEKVPEGRLKRLLRGESASPVAVASTVLSVINRVKNPIRQ
jgi:tetratricopeptide (TPR) repeat protein